MVFSLSTSTKMSLGSEPPRFGRMTGACPVVRSSEALAKATQGSAGSSRLAWWTLPRPRRTSTWQNPCRSRCRRWDDVGFVGADHVAQLAVRPRLARNGVDRLIRRAGGEGKHFE